MKITDEIYDNLKNLITFLFVPINGIVVLPILAKSYAKYKIGNLKIDKLRNSICVTYSQKEMIERMLLLVNIDKGIKTGLYDDKIAIQYALLKILVVNT